MKVSLRRRDARALRCAFCHDGLGVLRVACATCSAVLHEECRIEAGACPTLGCRRELRASPASWCDIWRRFMALVRRASPSLFALLVLLAAVTFYSEWIAPFMDPF